MRCQSELSWEDKEEVARPFLPRGEGNQGFRTGLALYFFPEVFGFLSFRKLPSLNKFEVLELPMCFLIFSFFAF